jgi:putative transposase
MRETFQIDVRRACRLAGFSRSGWYKPSTGKDQTLLRMRIREIAMTRPRFGYLRIHVMLRREGWRIGKNRVYRLYCLEGLQVRMRVRRRKHVAAQRGVIPVPTGERQRWSMDFVHDELLGGRKFRVLTVVDQWSRQSPILEARFSFTGKDVVAALERVREHRGLPDSITVDHGTEFMSRAVEAWAFYRGVKLDFTRPGKPTDNAHIESFNGRVRDECLNVHQFVSLAHAQRELDVWRTDYNTIRPHSSLGHLTPSEYATTGQDSRGQTGIS